jgi:polar amino acid transport system substrate-binding protein
MVKLISDGTLADIYRRNQLYDYYRGFIEEQEKKLRSDDH